MHIELPPEQPPVPLVEVVSTSADDLKPAAPTDSPLTSQAVLLAQLQVGIQPTIPAAAAQTAQTETSQLFSPWRSSDISPEFSQLPALQDLGDEETDGEEPNGDSGFEPETVDPDLNSDLDSEEDAPVEDDLEEVPAETSQGETEESLEIDLESELGEEDGLTPEELRSQLRLTADFQSYDPNSQTIIARGNVLLRLNDAIIESDTLWVNLLNRYALAEGDVLLTRGAQLVRGRRAEYNFIQQAGVVRDAVGTLFLPALDDDLASPLEGPTASRSAYDPINRNPDLQIRGDGSLQIGLSSESDFADDDDGQLRQLRFETDELSFGVEGWQAEQVRITNDPFSPPEIELRTAGLLLRNISPTQDELLLRRPRLVFDQGLSVPLLRSRILLSRGSVNPDDVNPVPIPVGIDGRDRGGLFLGRKVPLVTTDRTRLSVTPQFFLNRAFSGETDSPFDFRNFGAAAELRSQLAPRTRLVGGADLTSFDFSEVTENVRASLRLEQLIGDHRLSLQSSYRERLFNGSLGFQDVQASLGAVLLSPTIALGDTGLRLTYQASAQLINAETDREDLLASRGSDSGRVTLGRYQGSVALRRNFVLWRGDSKTDGPYRGLRYTPEPVVPYLQLKTGVRTTGTYYSNGDSQNSLLARVELEAQLGHLTRNVGDYTRLNLGYTQSFLGQADSPFLFDREVDRNVLSMGITQQVYGPFLLGFQTAISFDEGEPINTTYTLEYSRRTYGILLEYDTTQNTGAIGFRLSNFSWIGDTNPFDTPRIRRVEGGVIESR
ncbi:MAG: DUF3769 domain-containing protein [Cyanobacteria bacterium J06626_6]